MLDIPELDEMTCMRLDRNSLFQCDKVSKRWNEAVVSSIWRTISADINGEHYADSMTHEYFQSDELIDLALTILANVTALSMSSSYDVKTLFPFSKLKCYCHSVNHLSSLFLEVYKFQ
ncbi:hypothetical protein MVEG_06807 [Podila verticillata NRRL 6337]|nr:hypothetical protein MVEG_06807 [Podila verticillata NRRL 6337]